MFQVELVSSIVISTANNARFSILPSPGKSCSVDTSTGYKTKDVHMVGYVLHVPQILCRIMLLLLGNKEIRLDGRGMNIQKKKNLHLLKRLS